MSRRLPLISVQPPLDPSTVGDIPESRPLRSEDVFPGPPLPPLPLRPVRRLRRPGVETISRYARAGLPLIAEGLLDQAKAPGLWTPDYLRAHAGTLRAKSYVLREGGIRVDARRGFQLVEVSLRDYVAAMDQGRPASSYYRVPFARLPRKFQDGLPTPEVCAGARRLRSYLWLSASGTVSQLHFDLPHNLIAQLTGRKRFLLYPASEYFNLYPHAPWSSVPHLSRVDLGQPDFRAFPRLPLARGWHCDLQEGDQLLLPSRMWHYAFSLEPSVTVNFWWPPLHILPLSIASDAYKRLRGLNI